MLGLVLFILQLLFHLGLVIIHVLRDFDNLLAQKQAPEHWDHTHRASG